MIFPSLALSATGSAGVVLTAETHHWFLQGKRIFTGA